MGRRRPADGPRPASIGTLTGALLREFAFTLAGAVTISGVVAGHFPLTLVSGPGAAARNAIGVVLVGGMAIGTLFTLFVTPSLYVLIAKDHRAERARACAEPPEAEPPDEEPGHGEPSASPAE